MKIQHPIQASFILFTTFCTFFFKSNSILRLRVKPFVLSFEINKTKFLSSKQIQLLLCVASHIYQKNNNLFFCQRDSVHQLEKLLQLLKYYIKKGTEVKPFIIFEYFLLVENLDLHF